MHEGAPNNWRDAAVLQSGRHCETRKKITESRSKACKIFNGDKIKSILVLFLRLVEKPDSI
jgi:hypothetical protein